MLGWFHSSVAAPCWSAHTDLSSTSVSRL